MREKYLEKYFPIVDIRIVIIMKELDQSRLGIDVSVIAFVILQLKYLCHVQYA